MPKSGKSKRTAAMPAATKKTIAKSEETSLFGPQKRNFGIGGAIQPRRDLSRMLKWPRYIRIQRQRKVLKMRLKVPPSIAQFGSTMDLNSGAPPRPRSPAPHLPSPGSAAAWRCSRLPSRRRVEGVSPPAHPSRPFVPAATNLFKLLDKYKPEEKKAKKQRLAEMVRASAWDFGAAGGFCWRVAGPRECDTLPLISALRVRAQASGKSSAGKPYFVKCGLNHVTSLVEKKKAKLVVIAHDVEPIEVRRPRAGSFGGR